VPARGPVALRAAIRVVPIAAVLSTPWVLGLEAEDPALLECSCRGSGQAAREFMRVTEPRAVQRLMLDVAAEPRPAAYLDAALKKTGVTAGQFLALGLIRQNADRFEIAFSLLTREDRQKIEAVAEREGARLARSLLAHRSRIEAVVRGTSLPTSDWRATARGASDS
jgi:hypothetical protein